MSTFKLGDVCPWHNVEIEMTSCNRCCCNQGKFRNSEGEEVMSCDYSPVPTFMSPYKKGDMVWFLEYGRYPTYANVREGRWRGNHYEYKCGRKQSHSIVYATKEECRAALAESLVEEAISGIQRAKELVGGNAELLETLKSKYKNLLT